MTSREVTNLVTKSTLYDFKNIRFYLVTKPSREVARFYLVTNSTIYDFNRRH